jgi:hypothetical protein
VGEGAEVRALLAERLSQEQVTAVRLDPARVQFTMLPAGPLSRQHWAQQTGALLTVNAALHGGNYLTDGDCQRATYV